MSDLTCIYITANVLNENFANATKGYLLEALSGLPLISVSKKPIDFGTNICVGDTPRSQASIYRQALIGAKAATTPYVAIAEDDVIYSPEHFKYRPPPESWAYNMNSWSLFTWGDPLFTYKAPGGRRNLNGLICERDLLVQHLEERFKLWPDEVDINIFGEPGKYDNQLGTTPFPSVSFYTNPPNIVFSHEANLQFAGLGRRKGMGQIRANRIPYWGEARELVKLTKETI